MCWKKVEKEVFWLGFPSTYKPTTDENCVTKNFENQEARGRRAAGTHEARVLTTVTYLGDERGISPPSAVSRNQPLHTPGASLEKLHFKGRKPLSQSGWPVKTETKKLHLELHGLM